MMSDLIARTPSPINPVGEYPLPGIFSSTPYPYGSDSVPIQQLVSEEEPLITNTQSSPTIDYLRIPISLELLDSLSSLPKGDSSIKHSSLTAVRQRIGALMQKHIGRKLLDENSVQLNLYHYNLSSTTQNKIVNWYGVLLKIHQTVLQLGVLNNLRSIAHLQYLKKRRSSQPTMSPSLSTNPLSPTLAPQPTQLPPNSFPGTSFMLSNMARTSPVLRSKSISSDSEEDDVTGASRFGSIGGLESRRKNFLDDGPMKYSSIGGVGRKTSNSSLFSGNQRDSSLDDGIYKYSSIGGVGRNTSNLSILTYSQGDMDDSIKYSSTGGLEARKKSSTNPDAEEIALPQFLDWVIYWSGKRAAPDVFPTWNLRDPDSGQNLPAVYIELELILLCLNTHGTFDHLCQSLIASSLNHAIMRARGKEVDKRSRPNDTSPPTSRPLLPIAIDPDIDAQLSQLLEKLNVDPFEKRADRLHNIYSDALLHSVTTEKVNTYISKLISKNDSVVLSTIKELEEDIRALIGPRDRISLKRLERLLIPLLGHDNPEVTENCTRLLNVISDGNHWQLHVPFDPAIAYVNDPFKFSLELPQGVTLDSSITDRLIFLVRAPPLSTNNRISILTRHPTTYDKEKNIVSASHPNFYRAGYYDWRIAVVAEDGKYEPLNDVLPTSGLKLNQVQGRYIVHPRIAEEVIHEVFVDIQGASLVTQIINNRPVTLVKRGSFKTVIESLAFYKSCGITTLWLHGVLERDDNASISVASDRSTPKISHGGFTDLQTLIDKAHQIGLKVVVGTGQRISVTNTHRKYTPLLAQSIVSREKHILSPHPDIEGVGNDDKVWEDSFLLNWRKQVTWDNFIAEMSGLARQLSINGICISNAHTLPIFLTKDDLELHRVDPDGHLHYENAEILDGEVVLHKTQTQQKRIGYWDLSTRRWPNPLFVKLTKELWGKFPDFMILSGSSWRKNREPEAVRSGLIPLDYSLYNALVPVIRDGQSVQLIYEALENRNNRYPAGTIIVSPLCSHVLPYPIKTFNDGAWGAIDAMYFLGNHIPMTFVGELNGRVNPIFLTTPSTIQDTSSRAEIKGHYQHRAIVRKNNKVITAGKYIPLKAFHQFGAHNRVFVFCRQLGNQILIFGLNLNNSASTFYIDLSPLTPYFSDPTLIYQIINEWNYVEKLDNPNNAKTTNTTSNAGSSTHNALNNNVLPPVPEHLLTLEELLHGHHFTSVGPYETLFWRISSTSHTTSSPSGSELKGALYADSMARLMKDLSADEDHPHNPIYKLLKKGISSYSSFGHSLLTILSELPLESNPLLPQHMQQLYIHISKHDPAIELKILSYLSIFSRTKSRKGIRALLNTADKNLGMDGDHEASIDSLSDFCSKIIKANKIGPIVFICPELGRWSTVGGLGVMVDDLTQDLAALGCDVYVITPYYNRNRKGETGYLAHDGIRWVHNIHTWIGAERVEVGVHEGEVNGVHLIFLHHINYFPHVYPTGPPSYQTKVMVLMAKAALEACCHIRLIPAICVTNDWFTGLVPAYAKRSGAFGNVFHNTTFIHLIHNLGDGYQGWVYPDPITDTMNEIHQLNNDLLFDPHWDRLILNPSRAALMVADQWATVSQSYKNDLLASSTLAPLLRLCEKPFAVSNGLRKQAKLGQIARMLGHPLNMDDLETAHAEAKKIVQQNYFNRVDPLIPVCSFVGRITLQKGVHLILDSIQQLLDTHRYRIQIIVGGPADRSEPYAKSCAEKMEYLRYQYPQNFWADPNNFFTQGALINLGSDFGLMPSLFEPGGIVQHEFFVAGTPVIAFKTGGLKDTVKEYIPTTKEGNGFAFEAHNQNDFVWAVDRAIITFHDPVHYPQLRVNASSSVITTTDVAWWWFREICRLRSRISATEGAVSEKVLQIEAELGLDSLIDDMENGIDLNDEALSSELSDTLSGLGVK